MTQVTNDLRKCTELVNETLLDQELTLGLQPMTIT